MPRSTYTVSTAAFEGPFDLLLQLISRRKVDVWEVSVAEITEDYLSVLAEMEALDLEVTTEFLVIAATLMELKAARLLPDADDPEAEEAAVAARDLLYARLLDYRTFQHAAWWIGERLADQQGHVPREVGLEPPLSTLRPPVRLTASADRLAALAARALAESRRSVDTRHLRPVRLSVREAAGRIVDELARARGAATFAELTRGCRHRSETIAHFLALLELYKLELVDLDQPERLGTLLVRWEPDDVPPCEEALVAAAFADTTTTAPDAEDAGGEDAGGEDGVAEEAGAEDAAATAEGRR